MTIDPKLVELLIALGPAFLGVVGTILAAVLAALGALARFAWTTHTRRMKALAEAVSSLADALKTSGESNRTEHEKVWASIQGLRAELQLTNRGADSLKAGLLKVEGALESHRQTVYQHVERLVRIDSKLEAVFRFVDAPRRATDSGG